MAIYKKKASYKFATVRQGMFWAFWGLLGGIYSFPPLLKSIHRDERGYLSKLVEDDLNEMKNKNE